MKKYLQTGSALVFFAILLGAFGAHGLKKILDEAHLHTFKTGVDYQMIHGLALLILGLLQKNFSEINFNKTYAFMLCGIVLFCTNCYLYALTDIKAFAMIVPIGGVSFVVAWATLFFSIGKIRNN